MATNDNLRKAKQEQNGEFYTQLDDIEKELCHYTDYFNGKTIFCNCDDPYESQFFYYFATRFNDFKLKKLICTCYDGSPMAYTQMSFFAGAEKTVERKNRKAYKVVITEVKDWDENGVANIDDIDILLRQSGVVEKLKGNGDFRSDECIELLKEADIVVTNPPFSLFREYYVPQLIKYNKKFLVIGNKNAITYKDFFALIKADKLWVGHRNINSDMWFVVPEGNDYEKIVDGKRVKHIQGVWYTNLDIKRRHEPFEYRKEYVESLYQKYDNYDAINVDKVEDIPDNYFGVMGVPITFLGKHNPDEFEILGLGISTSGLEIGVRPYLPEHKKYRKEIQHKGAVDGDLYMLDSDGNPVVPYARILIRRRSKK